MKTLNETEFPNTTHALRQHLKGRSTEPLYQVVRRASQRMPPILRFFADNPDLAEALAADARQRQQEAAESAQPTEIAA